MRKSPRLIEARHAVATAVALCLLGTNSLFADDKDRPAPKAATPSQDTPAPADKSATDSDKPAKREDAADTDKPQPDKKAKPALSERLLKELIGDEAEKASNPLDSIITRMRSVQGRIQKTETDSETRQLQVQIVKNLDDLIEKLKKQPPPSKSNQNQSQSNPPPMGSDSSQNPMPRGGNQPKPQNSQAQQQQQKQQQSQPGSEQKTQQGAAGASQSSQARESNKNLGKPRTPEEEAARQRLAKDVWGHLPPALRQQLLNVYSEKFLPKYDDLVRKYYEALAEQNRKNP